MKNQTAYEWLEMKTAQMIEAGYTQISETVFIKRATNFSAGPLITIVDLNQYSTTRSKIILTATELAGINDEVLKMAGMIKE